MADLSQLLGNNALAGLLSVEQRQQAEQQAQNAGLLNLALGMIAGSRGAPGQGKPSLIQSAVPALQAGIQGYQGSFDKQLKDMLTSMQVKDLMDKRKAQQTLQQRLASATRLVPASTGLTSGSQQEQMLAAQLEGAAPEGVDMTRSALMSNVNLPKKEVVDQGAAQQAVLSYLQQVDPGKYAELMAKEPKSEPAAIQEYKFAVSQGYQGDFKKWTEEKAKAGASIFQMGAGDEALVKALGTKGAERLAGSLAQAEAAQNTLSRIESIRPLIKEGVFSGPLSGSARTVAQIGASLGITGGSTQELLNRTAQTMQGLAGFELDAAAAMRGQGAITENERTLIRRAAAGQLGEFTSGEVQTLLNAMEKTANFRISAHQKNLNVFKNNKNQAVRDAASMYELGALPTIPSAAGVLKFDPNTGKVK